jgi:SAM-dependent methyltransferase
MASTGVSVIVPLIAPLSGRDVDPAAAVEALASWLTATGLEFEIVVVAPPGSTLQLSTPRARIVMSDDARPGSMLRRAGLEAHASVVVIVDPDLPYPMTAIGEAVSMIDSGATDVVFAAARERMRHAAPLRHLLRYFLGPILPIPTLELKAFSADAARVLFREARLASGSFCLELAFLANKYGYRIERLVVDVPPARRRARFGFFASMRDVVTVRLTNRRMGYRAPRRCPVCFSHQVWNHAQIAGNIVRTCHRCKCRYLHRTVESGDDTARGVLRPHPPALEPLDGLDAPSSGAARIKTSARRLAALRENLSSRARLLEVGVHDDISFGVAASRELDYVGLAPAPAAARSARAHGLEVYCSTLDGFVNTGAAFDAVTLFHVLESMHDPHDALERIRELLKPGGELFLTTFDTEGFLYLLTEKQQMQHNFRTHVILYSRSALIELLERSGFEIVSIGPDFEYRDHHFLDHWLGARWPRLAPFVRAVIGVLPDPLIVSSGSIRIEAKRRAGSPLNVRGIRSTEPTHAR